MQVVFTDLDGTLLDGEYSFAHARPALALLKRLGIPLVLATSKTRAEVEVWRERLENSDPFIVENGGAAVFGQDVVVLGDPYPDLVRALRAASAESGVAVRGFGEMSDHEVSRLCGLPLEDAARARRREYDEPFVIPDPRGADRLVQAIRRQGKRHVRGGRLHHITGANDKAAAAAIVLRRCGGTRSIAVGDAWNDVGLLGAVDVPVIMQSPIAAELQRAVPHAILASSWSEGVLAALDRPGGLSYR